MSASGGWKQLKKDAVGLRKRLQEVKDRDGREWSYMDNNNALQAVGRGAYGEVFSFGSSFGGGSRKQALSRLCLTRAKQGLVIKQIPARAPEETEESWMRRSNKSRAMTNNEVNLMTRAQAANVQGIARLVALPQINGSLAMVMEDGGKDLESGNWGTTDIFMDIFGQVLSTLVSLHEDAGIAHMDVKPSNIVIKPVTNGNGATDFYAVKLVDFGSAQVVSDDGTVPKLHTFTENYLDPAAFVRVFDETNRVAEANRHNGGRINAFHFDMYALSSVTTKLFPNFFDINLIKGVYRKAGASVPAKLDCLFDLVSRATSLRLDHRLDIDEVKQHEFFQNWQREGRSRPGSSMSGEGRAVAAAAAAASASVAPPNPSPMSGYEPEEGTTSSSDSVHTARSTFDLIAIIQPKEGTSDSLKGAAVGDGGQVIMGTAAIEETGPRQAGQVQARDTPHAVQAGAGSGGSTASGDPQSRAESTTSAQGPKKYRARGPLKGRRAGVEAREEEWNRRMVRQKMSEMLRRLAEGASMPSEEARKEEAAKADRFADILAAVGSTLAAGGQGYAGRAGSVRDSGGGMGASGLVGGDGSAGENGTVNEQPRGGGAGTAGAKRSRVQGAVSIPDDEAGSAKGRRTVHTEGSRAGDQEPGPSRAAVMQKNKVSDEVGIRCWRKRPAQEGTVSCGSEGKRARSAEWRPVDGVKHDGPKARRAAAAARGKQEPPAVGRKRPAAAVVEAGEASDGQAEKGLKRTRRAGIVDGNEAAAPELPGGGAGGSADPGGAPAGLGDGTAGAGGGKVVGKGKGKGKGKGRAR